MRTVNTLLLELLDSLDGGLAHLIGRQAVVPLDQEVVDDSPDAHLSHVRQNLVLGALNVHLDDDKVMGQGVHEQPAGDVDGRQVGPLATGSNGIGMVLEGGRAPVVIVGVDLVEIERADAILGIDDGGGVDGDLLALSTVLLLRFNKMVVENRVCFEQEDF